MAKTVGGLSSSLGSSSSIRGVGGLASGLDRDSLIENMTASTTTKITQQQQAKQKLAWKQEAMRGITSKLYEFSQKYMSYTSSSNLLSGKLFSANLVTALGANSSAIKVSGSSSMAGDMSIAAIKQLAKNAQYTAKNSASTGELSGGYMENDLGTATGKFSNIAGTSMTVKYGTKYYSVSLPEDSKEYDYSTMDGVRDALNDAMGDVSIGNGMTLADVMKVETQPTDSADPSAGTRFILKNTDTAGNSISLAGGTFDLLSGLGFIAQGESFENLDETRTEITKDGLIARKDAYIMEEKTYAEQMGGKNMTFSYNGKNATISLMGAEDIKNAGANGMEALQKDLQSKLDDAFGKGRVKVGLESGTGYDSDKSRLTFKTMKPGTADEDNSSVLSVVSGDRGMLNKYGAFTGISSGDSNRLNLENSFLDAGLRTADSSLINSSTSDDDLRLVINGVSIRGITKESSVTDIMNAINNTAKAGVHVSYVADADRFTITSTQDGASGDIEMSGNVAEYLFGKEDIGDGTGGDYTVQSGQDAIVMVKYAGSNGEVEVTRGSNSFNLNGLTVTANKVFGYIDDPANPGSVIRDTSAEEITFDADVDADKAAETIAEMVKAYNEIVKLVNDEVSTKPNRKYDPLTAEQEDALSESEIKAWNEKAKAGMLFNDTDVRGLTDSLRFILAGDSSVLSKMGISVSTNYSENGKLVFDEEAFKSALREDPEAVKNAFTRPVVKEGDNTTDSGGLMVRMQTIMNKYASMSGSTKGILVERAGSIYAPTSILSNSLQKQMDSIDDRIADLYDKLEMEQDRYISQFTSLETLVSQMNSQSSWLSGAFGG